MAELGVGTRVFVGWTNDVTQKDAHYRLKTGTICDGPTIEIYRSNYVYFWKVQFDVGDLKRVAEHLLSPIDDGEWFNDEDVFQGQPKETTCS